jgi:outer membrane protein OmpA-like peptidoglycan-associated protein
MSEELRGQDERKSAAERSAPMRVLFPSAILGLALAVAGCAALQPQPQTVYFASGKPDLGSEALNTIRDVASVLRARNVSVMIRGYSDTCETDEQSCISKQRRMELSKARAERTKEQLIAAGLSAQKITRVEGFGDTDLAVSTGDGISHVLNRRAVMIVSAGGIQ